MKNIYYIIFFLFFSIVGLSQELVLQNDTVPRIKVGLFTELPFYFGSSIGYGYKVGIVTQYKLNSQWSVQAGIGFEHSKDRESFYDEYIYLDNEPPFGTVSQTIRMIHLNSLYLPLEVSYQLRNWKISTGVDFYRSLFTYGSVEVERRVELRDNMQETITEPLRKGKLDVYELEGFDSKTYSDFALSVGYKFERLCLELRWALKIQSRYQNTYNFGRDSYNYLTNSAVVQQWRASSSRIISIRTTFYL